MRNPGLDLIRFAAIALVLGSHFLGLASLVPGVAGQFLQIWERGGWIGVDLFFVLSGFLVCNLLLEEYARTGAIRVGRFLLRRGFKIYPAFYFFTLVASLVFLAEGQFLWPRLASEIFFVQNYCLGWWLLPAGVAPVAGQIPLGMIDQAQWSLAVEEHFYFLIAWVCVALLRVGRQIFPWICLGMCLLCGAFRVGYAYENVVSGFGPAQAWTHFRLDSLFFGALLAYGYRYHGSSFLHLVGRHRLILGLLCSLGFLPFFLVQRSTSPIALLIFGLTPLYFCCGGVLALVLLVGDSAILRTRFCRGLAFLGRHSYGIYLWHLLVRYFVWRCGGLLWGPQPQALTPLLAYLLISVFVGVGASLLVEVPFLRLRERLVP